MRRLPLAMAWRQQTMQVSTPGNCIAMRRLAMMIGNVTGRPVARQTPVTLPLQTRLLASLANSNADKDYDALVTHLKEVSSVSTYGRFHSDLISSFHTDIVEYCPNTVKYRYNTVKIPSNTSNTVKYRHNTITIPSQYRQIPSNIIKYRHNTIKYRQIQSQYRQNTIKILSNTVKYGRRR